MSVLKRMTTYPADEYEGGPDQHGALQEERMGRQDSMLEDVVWWN